MSIGYLGYAQLGEQFVLCNSTGLNRQINHMLSTAVWGAGWYDAAQHTHVAESQQYFEGGINFELQGDADLWNWIRDWLIEQRAYADTVIVSPNGFAEHSHALVDGDARSGAWCKSCSFTIDKDALITLAATAVALKKSEVVDAAGYAANKRAAFGTPLDPLNPAPRNTNPIPGWYVEPEIVWPGIAAFWDAATPQGLVLSKININVNNNTQLVRGCTKDPTPVAVVQGVIHCEGSMDIWRDGGIPDPFIPQGTFTPSAASISLDIANLFDLDINNVLLTTDAYDVGGQNALIPRTFGFAGMGDTLAPPILMAEA